MIQILFHMAEVIGGHLWAVSWQVVVLVSVVWLVEHLSFKASSRFLYWLWCIVLIRLFLPANLHISELAVPLTDTVATTVNQVLPLQSIVNPSQFLSGSNTVEIINLPDVLDVFGVFWMLAVVLISILVLYRRNTVKNILKTTQQFDSEVLINLLRRNQVRMHIRQCVGLRVMENDVIGVPAVIGILRPYIILPRTMVDKWSEEELEPIIRHELGHIRQHDLLVNFIQIIIQIVYFFNPFVWYTNYRIRQIREEISDDIAINFTAQGKATYTRSVVKYLDEKHNEPALGLIGLLEKKSFVVKRIQRIMRHDYDSNGSLTVKSGVVLVCIAILSFALACESQVISSNKASDDLNAFPVPSAIQGEYLVITIDGNDTYHVNEKVTTASGLAEVLSAEMEKTNTKTTLILGADASPEDITFVIDTVNNNGIENYRLCYNTGEMWAASHSILSAPFENTPRSVIIESTDPDVMLALKMGLSDGKTIVEESDVVTINDGEILTRNIDYVIDYENGEIMFYNEKVLHPKANMIINYQETP